MEENKRREAVVVAYGRSALGKANKGSLVDEHPVEYGAKVLKGVLKQLPGLDLGKIEDLVMGCSNPADITGYNIARSIAQRAGLPDEVGGQTLTRFCASGLQSIEVAANAIRAGEMDIVIAGGIEKMSGMTMGCPEEYQDPELNQDIYMSMGVTAENVAEMFNISREDMDEMAYNSHMKALAAQKAGKFDEEIIPIVVKKNGEEIVFSKDEGIRPTTTIEGLRDLKPCFIEGGRVTAATSSQMTDGAAFVVLMAREKAEELGYKPIATFVSFATVGVPSRIMGIGPIKAVPKVMERTSLTIEDMDCIEINEAFAAQSLACIRELKLPMEKVNPNGGAMALGHPLGATGSVLTCKLLSELKRIGGKYGLVTMCVGTGMGAAGIFRME